MKLKEWAIVVLLAMVLGGVVATVYFMRKGDRERVQYRQTVDSLIALVGQKDTVFQHYYDSVYVKVPVYIKGDTVWIPKPVADSAIGKCKAALNSCQAALVALRDSLTPPPPSSTPSFSLAPSRPHLFGELEAGPNGEAARAGVSLPVKRWLDLQGGYEVGDQRGFFVRGRIHFP